MKKPFVWPISPVTTFSPLDINRPVHKKPIGFGSILSIVTSPSSSRRLGWRRMIDSTHSTCWRSAANCSTPIDRSSSASRIFSINSKPVTLA
jgi:hypothetical protein